MERKGQTAMALSGDEVVALIQQRTEEFGFFLNKALADVGNADTGGRTLYFAAEAEADQLEALGTSLGFPMVRT